MIREQLRSNRHGWVIVVVSFVALGVVMSMRATLGLLMPVWEAEFGWSRSFISAGGAVLLVVMAVVAPLAGEILDRYGPRYLFGAGLALVGLAIGLASGMEQRWQFIAFFCVVGGLGCGIVGMPLITTTIATYFDTNRGIATSFGTAGVSVGQLFLLPLLAVLFTAIGWRTGYLGYGIFLVVLGAAAVLIVRGPPRRKVGLGRERTRTLPAKLRFIFTRPAFWFLSLGYVICGFTTTGVVKVHLLPYAALSGYAPLTGATAYGLLAAFNLVGMLLAGWLADRMRRPVLLASIYALRALTFVLLMFIANDASLLFLFAVVFGMLDFATVPVIASLVASHLGIRVMGLTMGMMLASHSLGGALGSFLGGWLYDLFGHYDWVWNISLVLALLAALLSLCIRAEPPQAERAALPAAA